MQITRTSVRTWATGVFFALAAAIIFGVIAQWFIQAATDKGMYAGAGETWDRLVAPFVAILVSAPILALAVLLGGVAAGLRLDAYLAQRSARRWWENVQAFTISDAACLLANVRRSEFEKSDRALAIANELRGYVNSGEVPLFLEFQYEKPPPDFSDPKAGYEPPYGKKEVGFDAVIAKRTVEGMARGRKWPLPWSLPPKSENEFPRPWKRPQPPPRLTKNALLDALSGKGAVGLLGTPEKEEDEGSSG